jgi:hypothetical protein
MAPTTSLEIGLCHEERQQSLQRPVEDDLVDLVVDSSGTAQTLAPGTDVDSPLQTAASR